MLMMGSCVRIQIIHPANSRLESLVVGLTLLGIFSTAGALLWRTTEQHGPQRLREYQISAYQDLSPLEQGTFNDLYAAAMEVESVHEDEGGWMSIADLEEFFIPPFIQDIVWQKRGALHWTQPIIDTRNIHITAYLGQTTAPATSGSFLLVLSHLHGAGGGNILATSLNYDGQTFGVWYHSQAVSVAQSITRESLIVQGWEEVIPYRGEDEIKRLKGNILS